MEEQLQTNGEFQNNVIMKERKRWAFFGIPWTFTKYTLMNKKLVLTEGLLKTVENEILLYRVLDMSLSRGLMQKMFGLGTVTVYSHDKTNPTLVIKNIKHAREFRDALADAVEKDRIRMKMRQSEFIDQHIDMPDTLDF
ncbi:MAG: PH domain-containing protein [Acutalibacteraceae bacterium]